MDVPGLNLQRIPATRRVRSDTELRQFVLSDRREFEASASKWVRTVARMALDDALGAGNPRAYVVGIDGATTASGAVRQRFGSGFRPGSIEQANRSVRIEFIGKELAEAANGLRPILTDVIALLFPNSATGRLKTKWSWYVQRDRHVGPKSTPAVRIGQTVPQTVGIYDVLWLAPDGPYPARYAWFANHNLVATRGPRTRGGRRAKKARGYLAEAARKMRAKRTPGLTVQGFFIKGALTGPQTSARHGVPAIRVAFKYSLYRPVIV